MTAKRSRDYSLAVFSVCLLAILLLLFHNSLDPGKVLFSNDGPLGALNQRAFQFPSSFTGVWFDLNTIGSSGGSASPSLTQGLFWLLGPAGFANLFAPIILFLFGLSAWSLFSSLQLGRWACALGGLAAALNSGFFSVACWGVGPQVICFACVYLALAALAIEAPRWSWLKFVLAGLALGFAVMEGADIGAIFSVFFAAFVFYSALISEGPPLGKIARGVGRVALVAVFAGFIATQTLNVLIGTSIKGIAGTEQDTETKAHRWDFSTQWSLPKRETLSLIVPGLFGYRMDTPRDMAAFPEWFEGGVYWGAIGRDPAWDRYFKGGEQGPAPSAEHIMRQTGGGAYLGLPVVLIALWAALQALRKKDSVFTLAQRKTLWFWIGTVIVCLLFAFGRFAPFYRLLYALPYFSTIRNPVKFVAVLIFATIILFAYGVDGLVRRYMVPALNPPNLKNRVNGWWATASKFDRRWVIGSVMAAAVSLVGWLIYASARTSLEHYLQTVHFDESMARAIAGFSIGQAGWFVLFLFLTVALMAGILSRRFAGERAKLGLILLGSLLVVDLGRANLPWIVYWDYKEKYASNPVLDLLRERPYEHRVAILPFQTPPQFSTLSDLYRFGWSQHNFLYYNIQSLDIVQMPRMPVDLATFESALYFDPRTPTSVSNTLHHIARRWQLTNTRYLLGAAGFLEILNQQLDPLQHRFRIAAAFNIVPKPGVANATRLEELTAEISPQGQYAIFEFTGALPRAKLYTNWQVNTNDQATLDLLTSRSFDPTQTVLVNTPLPPSSASTGTNQTAGSVEFVGYAPKQIVLHAKSSGPSVLLLNDKFDPDWKVSVDGTPATLLRCNFIMRGVQVPDGDHQIEFRFAPSVKGLYVSLAGIVLGLGLAGFLVFPKREEQNAESKPAKGK